MVGSAVETIVWSSADSSMPSRIVTKMMFIWARDSRAGSLPGASLGRVDSSWLNSHPLEIGENLPEA